jgi:hypothetical protein
MLKNYGVFARVLAEAQRSPISQTAYSTSIVQAYHMG